MKEDILAFRYCRDNLNKFKQLLRGNFSSSWVGSCQSMLATASPLSQGRREHGWFVQDGSCRICHNPILLMTCHHLSYLTGYGPILELWEE